MHATCAAFNMRCSAAVDGFEPAGYHKLLLLSLVLLCSLQLNMHMYIGQLAGQGT
jgi:hypothetical protein